MKLIATLVFLGLTFSSARAFSDQGLLGSSRTLGYFLMPASDFNNYSSGLIYRQQQGEGQAIEVIYTSFKSAYLLTNNITQLGLHKKYRFGRFGPLAVAGTIGLGAYYSPAVGGGLTGDLGGELSARLLENLALAVPVYGSIFSDGFWLNIFAAWGYQPGFLKGYELFGGYRLNMSTTSLSPASASGTTNSYYALGVRTAL